MQQGTNVKIIIVMFCWFVVYNCITMHGANNIYSVNNAWNCDFEFCSVRFRLLSSCKYGDITALINTVRAVSNLMEFETSKTALFEILSVGKVSKSLNTWEQL